MLHPEPIKPTVANGLRICFSNVFKLMNNVWKVNWSTTETKKEPESPRGIEAMTAWTLGGCSIHCKLQTHRELAHLHLNSVKCSSWVLVTQWIESSSSVREVMDLIPVGVFLCHMLVTWWLTHFSHFITELKIPHLYSLINTHEA